MDFFRAISCISCCHVCPGDMGPAELKPRQLKLTKDKRWRTSRVLEASRRWSRRPASPSVTSKDEKRFTGFDMFSILATCPEEHPVPQRLSAFLRPQSSVQDFDLIGKSFSSMCLDEDDRFLTQGSRVQDNGSSHVDDRVLLDENYQDEPDLPFSSLGGSNQIYGVQSMANRPLSVVYEYPESHTLSPRLSRATQFSVPSDNQPDQSQQGPERNAAEPDAIKMKQLQNP